MGFTEGNIQSFNRYAYANNNPYKYVDPDGREVLDADEGRKKYGKGKGHHWGPFKSLADIDVSSEAREFFGKVTSGESIPATIHNKDHPKYNNVVKDLLSSYAEEHDINLSKMTKSQAKDFLGEVMNSNEPTIKSFRIKIDHWNKLPESTKKLYKAMQGLGKVMPTIGVAIELSTPSTWRAPQCQLGIAEEVICQ